MLYLVPPPEAPPEKPRTKQPLPQLSPETVAEMRLAMQRAAAAGIQVGMMLMAALRDEQRASDPAPSLPVEALEFVRRALADVTEAQAASFDPAAREVFVIVPETDVDLTERLLVLLEDRLRATIPDLLVTVRSNPSGRRIESIAPGVVFYERGRA